ncbi:sigma factor-like helix-turn-helix DNA-binding protein [Kitasatospora viridis]|uniref:DNA-directed RNA polymerase specialized sigma24 family protein n=1 Tax=Kitasatospora viridis TaxID=281105 RepID=A0A561UAG4_9ACTN|nr:sigma factor-like helix-turn-helix DNA-binding protein [Kitasatospora viridis]TWF96353.1 DNA-directed RNA polymerase specialized sigma24 family protein [Kitasatospora viridis]
MEHQEFPAELHAMARRLLGSAEEAERALREARRRADRAEELSPWLTTLVGRVALERVRERPARGERSPSGGQPEPDATVPALLVVLGSLPPAERLALLLLDLFDLPLAEAARILGASEQGTCLLAEQAHDRLQGRPPVPRHQVS